MKLNKSIIALATVAAFSISGQTMAAGTDAGTIVQNEASLSFDINGTSQTALTSTASFQVDNRVDMTLSTAEVQKKVVPGATITFAYSLANTGNAEQVFEMSIGNSADTLAATDDGDIAVTGITYSGLVDGTLANTNYITVAEDATATFNVTVTIPLVRDGAENILNEDEFVLLTTATAVADTSGTALSDDTGTDKNALANLNAATLIVLADSASTLATTDTDVAFNGTVSVLNIAEIETATFVYVDPNGDTVNGLGLSVLVATDTLCGTAYTLGVATCDGTIPTYTPKAIPDATVEYTITATNSGTVAAENVVITQDLSTLDSLDAISADLQPGSLANAVTNLGTATITGDVLTVDVGTVAANGTVTITFTAIVE
jgi:hypothetical protein